MFSCPDGPQKIFLNYLRFLAQVAIEKNYENALFVELLVCWSLSPFSSYIINHQYIYIS